jgi:hypothetical protein
MRLPPVAQGGKAGTHVGRSIDEERGKTLSRILYPSTGLILNWSPRRTGRRPFGFAGNEPRTELRRYHNRRSLRKMKEFYQMVAIAIVLHVLRPHTTVSPETSAV